MTKEAAAVLALGIAGAIITCGFVFAFYESGGVGWFIAAMVTAWFTMSKLYEIARTPGPAVSR